ncbi:nuclear speckle RNA-binding protein B [Cocos nucifera]|uniref:Nuclear speckle RNA-binding protein B n=1 Tax=Cocos nucifera TaxID=13894 RepID=A0A8K0IMI4_COCNU|nr:nuclear speckle RNA-binding protein B [Cocos nucifera]
MDSSETPTGRASPRQELRSPQPPCLKVRKDPSKIKKPPVAPPPPRPTVPPPQHRPPVIIYTDSPKVIHTTPSEFMSLVQRLTGAASSSSSATNAAAARSPSNVTTVGETASSTARLDTIEKGAHPSDAEGPRKNGDDVFDQLGIDGGALGIDGGAPSCFFSSPMEPNSLNLLHEPNPAFDGNRNFVENTFLASPAETSTGGYWDPFNHYQDFDQFDP